MDSQVILLRDYQNKILDGARALMRSGVKSLIIESPVGSGKTALTAEMIKNASARGIRCWFLLHRIELVRQSMEAFRESDVNFGVVATGFTMDDSLPVQICSIQTLKRRLDKMAAPGMIVYDEAHHVCAKSWVDIRTRFPNAYHIGLSATPERLDGKGIGDHFKSMVPGPSTRWLIKNGFLSDYRLIVPPYGINVEGIHHSMGDFNAAELAVVADVPTITGSAVQEYSKRAAGKRAIARGVNIHHSKDIASQFNAAGVRALHVDGKTPHQERRAALESFSRGETLVLSNVDLFSEGLNVPSVECILDLRPTESLSLWIQFCGRALRPMPGKEKAVLIDFAGNYRRHGLPCEPREWSLEGRKKNSKKVRAVQSTECPKCYGVFVGILSKCPDCGHDFGSEGGGGRTVEHKDGDLVEVNLDAARALRAEKIQKWRDISQAKTLDDFKALGVKFGFKPGWAHIRFKIYETKMKEKGDMFR